MLFPRGPREVVQAVMLNTSGGVTGGDHLEAQITAGPGSALTVTSQAAERIYRSGDGRDGQVINRIAAETGATLHWLPQETIVFDGARLDRRLDIDLTDDAHFLMVEPILFGRLAMGETVQQAHIRDHITLRRGGKLIFADRTRLTDDVQALLDRAATGGSARAMASVLMVRPDAETMLPKLRALLPETGGATLLAPDILFARILAPDGHDLRTTLIPALHLLGGADLPRTWML